MAAEAAAQLTALQHHYDRPLASDAPVSVRAPANTDMSPARVPYDHRMYDRDAPPRPSGSGAGPGARDPQETVSIPAPPAKYMTAPATAAAPAPAPSLPPISEIYGPPAARDRAASISHPYDRPLPRPGPEAEYKPAVPLAVSRLPGAPSSLAGPHYSAPISPALSSRRLSTEQSHQRSPRPPRNSYVDDWPHDPHSYYPGHPQLRQPAVRETLPPAPASVAYGPPHGEPAPRHAYDDAWRARPAEEEVKKPLRPPYGDSVKRHLDVYDFEQSLNEMARSTRDLLDFSSHYRQKAFEMARTGPTPDSFPSLAEVDAMMKAGTHAQEALGRLRSVVLVQEAEMAELSRAQTKAAAAAAAAAELAASSAPLAKAEPRPHAHGLAHGFGADTKKRRGRAVAPGKCHSCNRVDTPEWRRGPDGARTLCNACGLHYAKVTRKANKAQASAPASGPASVPAPAASDSTKSSVDGSASTSSR